ncbi:MAG: DUF2163 domain-containing protein [Gemmobacter sp.]
MSGVALCWTLTRRDGAVFGFTDHDADLVVEGVVCRAATGWTAAALEERTGLAVGNTEVAGGLSDAGITEADILAGRFDGARIAAFEVNWAGDGVARRVFAGTMGEVTQAGAAFRAEVRGLAEGLNRAIGRVFQRSCSAVLGDRRCGVDLARPEFSAEAVVISAEAGREVVLDTGRIFAPGWFEGGRLMVLDGAAAGLAGGVKADRAEGGTRRALGLWVGLGAEIAPGTRVRIEAGCDRQAGTCRAKFGNFANYRGFPHVPGDDWLLAYPAAGGAHDGGSRG